MELPYVAIDYTSYSEEEFANLPKSQELKDAVIPMKEMLLVPNETILSWTSLVKDYLTGASNILPDAEAWCSDAANQCLKVDEDLLNAWQQDRSIKSFWHPTHGDQLDAADGFRSTLLGTLNIDVLEKNGNGDDLLLENKCEFSWNSGTLFEQQIRVGDLLEGYLDPQSPVRAHFNQFLGSNPSVSERKRILDQVGTLECGRNSQVISDIASYHFDSSSGETKRQKWAFAVHTIETAIAFAALAVVAIVAGPELPLGLSTLISVVEGTLFAQMLWQTSTGWIDYKHCKDDNGADACWREKAEAITSNIFTVLPFLIKGGNELLFKGKTIEVLEENGLNEEAEYYENRSTGEDGGMCLTGGLGLTCNNGNGGSGNSISTDLNNFSGKAAGTEFQTELNFSGRKADAHIAIESITPKTGTITDLAEYQSLVDQATTNGGKEVKVLDIAKATEAVAAQFGQTVGEFLADGYSNEDIMNFADSLDLAPQIKLRIYSCGPIKFAELATLEASPQLSGNDIMKVVDTIMEDYDGYRMYLSDEARVDSLRGPSNPSTLMNFRMFRYFTGKTGWYEAFGFEPVGDTQFASIMNRFKGKSLTQVISDIEAYKANPDVTGNRLNGLTDSLLDLVREENAKADGCRTLECFRTQYDGKIGSDGNPINGNDMIFNGYFEMLRNTSLPGLATDSADVRAFHDNHYLKIENAKNISP